MRTRAEQAIRWIHRYCVTPTGARVRLSHVEAETVRAIYDHGVKNAVISGRLAAYLALLHTCGIEAPSDEPSPDFQTNIFTVWNAAGPELRRVLKREGEAIICPALGT